jgi:hypothetical protein
MTAGQMSYGAMMVTILQFDMEYQITVTSHYESAINYPTHG